MTREEAIRTLSLHLMQCGAMMPIEWVTTHGEGSPFMEAYKMAMDALKEKDAPTPVTNADRIRAMSDEELAWELMEWRVDARAKVEGSEPALPDTQKTICEWLKQTVV